CCSLSAVYYLFTAYTERVFLPSLRLFKQPLRLEGNLNLKQIAGPVSVVENNSIVPLIILGLFGAYSTLRKKELQIKLTRN
ncbi:MAG: hypothetical protein V7L04_06385, partial [Nostoc sp.]|uniref:hypothetical protein n=1 Tax=Nostoc sp. TaxID=1180 RepID=UPI002FF63C5F